MNQRWSSGRSSYRPGGEPIRTSEYRVAAIETNTEARNFLRAHHYASSYPVARRRFGLYARGGRLMGVAVFSHPVSDATLTNVFPVAAADALELGRFALRDSVAGNGESWFLGRCFDALKKEGFYGVVSFSDPVPRPTGPTGVVMRGHWGCIYQAHNGVYLGRNAARTEKYLPDGSLYSDRAVSKLAARSQGWRYAADQLVRAGADPPAGGDLAAWGRAWTARLCRTARHPGKHKYAWVLNTRDRDALPPSRPYPKGPDRAIANN